MKKVGVYITVLLLLVGIATANYYNDWYFKNEAGTQVTQIKMIGWRCEPKNSPTCASVKRTIPFTIQTMPLSSGTTNYIKSEFTAATSVPEYFILYAYHPDYQLAIYSWEFSTYSGMPIKAYTRNEILHKLDNCKADFTLDIQSCAEAGMPLSILTDTELSASTSSAFIINTFYWPPELAAWRDISTKVTATVKKQGTTTNVYSSEDTKKIYAGTTEDFSFLWQTSKNTLPGNYIITMKSFVTDPKCDQTNDVVTTVTQTVNIAASLDGCVAQVQNFRLEPISPTPANQVLIKGDHLHTYQDWSWDSATTACTAGNAKLLADAYLPVAYSLKIKQQPSNSVVKTLTGSLPTNSGTYNTYKAFQIPWTPTAAQCGSFIAELTTTSSPAASYACTAASKTTTATKAFTIGNDNDQDGYYNLCGDCDDSSTGQYTNPGSANPYCNCNDNDGKVKGTEICDAFDNDCDDQINDYIVLRT